MIILSQKKINTNFKETIQNYLNTVNFGYLECPNPKCHSHNLIRWGYYERNAIYFSNNSNVFECNILKIQRVRCKSCGKTHALLPFGIIPYKQFTDEVISKVLYELTFNTLSNVLDKYTISQSVIKNWCIQYNKFHKANINTLIQFHNSEKSLTIFLSNIINKIHYIDNYKKCFMQIKKGCLDLCPS